MNFTHAQASLGIALLFEGQIEQAKNLLESSLDLGRKMGCDPSEVLDVLESLAAIAVTQNELLRATRLYGAVWCLGEKNYRILVEIAQNYHRQKFDVICSQLDEATFTEAWKDGSTMPLYAAVDYAIGHFRQEQ